MAMRRTVLSGLAVWVGTLLAGVSPAMGQTFSCPMGESLQTEGSCELGVCDDPDERNLWLTGATTSLLRIPIKFIVFAEDDGSNRAATQTEINAQLAELNDAYKDEYKIEFFPNPPPTDFVNSSRFLHFCSNLEPGVACRGPDDQNFCSDPTDTEELAMKTLAADNPDGQLNVYVTDTQLATIAWGFFPWCDDATGVMRGVVIDDARIGGAFDCLDPFTGNPVSCRTLVHEIGHTLGLWHSYRGTGEPAELAGCCENRECTGDCSNPACDRVGDLCCDTAAQSNVTCGFGTGFDCDGNGLASAGDVSNYMSNGGDGCWNHFTPQQAGRVHCWTCDSLTGFLSGEPSGSCCRPDGACQETSQTCCDNIGGGFAAGATCALGGCCLPDGSCTIDSDSCCADAGGSFSAGGTCDVGACCLPDGTCSVDSDSCCAGAGGAFTAGATCDTGACCLPDGTCSDLSEECCRDAGGCFGGAGTSCASETCGACCPQPFGRCFNTHQDCCDAQGGLFDPGNFCHLFYPCAGTQGPVQWP